MATEYTRKELRHDAIALGVGKTLGYAGAHRGQIVKIGGAVLALIVIVAGVFYYRNAQREVRQSMLGEAIAAQNAPVGQAPPTGGLSYPTEAAKRDAVAKAYQRLVSEHGGSTEGYIAQYTLGSLDAEAGRNDEARRKFQDVIDHADANYASLAKLSLAQLNFATGKTAEAQTLLKDLIANPTELVSKNQATYTLARGLAPTQPEEARKLLVPLASAGTEISQTAVQAISDLPPQK